MKRRVILSIRGTQYYQEQDPEVIQLTTEGVMELRDGGWDICYEESELTGLKGVTTTFRVEPDKVILIRSGSLNSQMIFQQGIAHESLYQMDFGALMLSVCATFVFYDSTPDGGVIDLQYSIEIEQTAAGIIDYHLDISAIDEG